MSTAAGSMVEIFESGDSALRVVATLDDAELNWSLVHRLAQWLEASGADGVHGAAPTYDSALVEFDPLTTSARQVGAFIQLGLRQLGHEDTPTREPRSFEVPVVYGGDFGPDLADVARHQGLTTEQVVALHSAGPYKVRCLGAPAGSPMMDGPDFPLPVPRLKDPRISVPAGAVAVAGRQAVIAPAAAPGGWCVIGRTPLTVLDITRDPLVPYLPGDTITFRPIAAVEFEGLSGRYLQALR
ncbi:allophanate hydrolase [Arthrobacter sp. ERGS1:01]|uniref:5-oxoprolinase subunit B family protein n=1 Tax=Arthrobacter sp. ERGS1:01 TaxID=1704044 RepID=UPI0006B4B303|nr:carboxyltransferase domain-containing protein [Arthrobacter sp. ERGS1:01]ALE07405.1 allophanate hydrolase [Arthrobacter sp. ERGS1:01]